MRSKRGFTLIELLAVIVILAVIALIATPLIMGTIEKAKRNAFKDTAYAIMKSAEDYVAEENAMATGEYTGDTFTFPDDKKLNFKGTRPSSGFVSVSKKGKTNLAFSNQGYCAIKTVAEKEIKVSKGKCRDINFDNLKELQKELEKQNQSNMKIMTVGGINVKKITGTKANANNIKNHVWFSGIMWQVIEMNDKGIKLISEDSLTSIPYGNTNDWNGSWVRKWLNQDILKTAMGSNFNMLSGGYFCLDAHASDVTQVDYQIATDLRKKITSFTPHTTCTNISTDKVGLMTFEDYVYALDGTANGTIGESFLDKDEMEWTLTPTGESNKVWHTYYFYPAHLEKDWKNTKENGKAVRPVIYLDSSTLIVDGTGTKYDPYMIFGDELGHAGEKISDQNPGEYVYLTEKNPYTNKTEQQKFRIVQIESNGTTKLERNGVLRNLPNTISANSDFYVPYYSDARDTSNTKWCADVNDVWYTGGCKGHNYFKPTEGTGAFERDKGMNIGYFLNHATNSYKSWLQNQNTLTSYNYDLPVYRNQDDYSIGLDRSKDIVGQSAYQNNTYDGTSNVYVGLPQMGEFLSGNDINKHYWYMNRGLDSTSYVSFIYDSGITYELHTNYSIVGVRPVLHLKSDIKIKSGNGTPNSPYVVE